MLRIGAKVMLTVDLEIQDCLINGQMTNLTYIEFARDFSDEQAGAKIMRLSFLGRQKFLVPIEKCETEIPINKRSTSPSIKRTQFLLTLA